MNAYLQITLNIANDNRKSAAMVYTKYKEDFLNKIEGAKSKELLIRGEDVQVLHGFDNIESAQNYLKSELFNHDVVNELKPLLETNPEIKIYTVV